MTQAEEQLVGVLASVAPTDSAAEKTAWERLDSLTKPPRSLGRLEELAAHVARVQGSVHPDVARKAIVLAAGDHGVVEEGVSPFPQDVTWQMVANFTAGGAAINQLAASVGADLVLVDVGVARDISKLDGVRHEKIAQGTRNMTLGPAMTREEAARAVLVGVRIAEELCSQGVTLVGTGEMGIGNSTAAAALTAAYTDTDPANVVGRGTGLDDAGVRHKRDVVRRALDVNEVQTLDPLGVLSALGGFEIACLAGVAIGAAAARTCVVTDGFISGAAALAAVSMCPTTAYYIFPSHRSAEPGHWVALNALGLSPVLELDMRLGEGTGAALAMGIIDAACRMMSGMATFAEAGVAETDEA
ncbi:MAG: nicotinate-nucleotide--dimethylbenzimidazole phosphoribosyltransferase [Coriobacteriia bacterium]|nr:nicotinate-nucleotide--dimethylbenzimidazole phosphoribosyltransferase [Coriobacteriia bacterium]